jgi:hypothetical protein
MTSATPAPTSAVPHHLMLGNSTDALHIYEAVPAVLSDQIGGRLVRLIDEQRTVMSLRMAPHKSTAGATHVRGPEFDRQTHDIAGRTIVSTIGDDRTVHATWTEHAIDFSVELISTSQDRSTLLAFVGAVHGSNTMASVAVDTPPGFHIVYDGKEGFGGTNGSNTLGYEGVPEARCVTVTEYSGPGGSPDFLAASNDTTHVTVRGHPALFGRKRRLPLSSDSYQNFIESGPSTISLAWRESDDLVIVIDTDFNEGTLHETEQLALAEDLTYVESSTWTAAIESAHKQSAQRVAQPIAPAGSDEIVSPGSEGKRPPPPPSTPQSALPHQTPGCTS